LGAASPAGVIRAVCGATPADNGYPVPGTDAHRLPGGTARPDRGAARSNRLAAHCAVLGSRHELQGGFGAVASICAGTGANGPAFRCCGRTHDKPSALWLPDRPGRRRGALSFLGNPDPLALGCLRRTRLLHTRTLANPSTRAVPVPVADSGSAATAHAVLLRLDPAITRTAAALDHTARNSHLAWSADGRLAAAHAQPAVLAGHPAVLRSALHHQQRHWTGAGLRASQPLCAHRRGPRGGQPANALGPAPPSTPACARNRYRDAAGRFGHGHNAARARLAQQS